MTNREFYNDKIVEHLKNKKDLCLAVIVPFVHPMFDMACTNTSCAICNQAFSVWLNEEHIEPKNPAEDWAVDTKVYVSNDPFSEEHKGIPRYFKEYHKNDNCPYVAYKGGKTSFTVDSDLDVVSWKYCRLAEEGKS